jgi:hypothetical protein
MRLVPITVGTDSKRPPVDWARPERLRSWSLAPTIVRFAVSRGTSSPEREPAALQPRGQPGDEGPHGVERRSPEHAGRPRARVEHEDHRERALVPLERDELARLAVLEHAHLLGADVGHESALGVRDDQCNRAGLGRGRGERRGGRQEGEGEGAHGVLLFRGHCTVVTALTHALPAGSRYKIELRKSLRLN